MRNVATSLATAKRSLADLIKGKIGLQIDRFCVASLHAGGFYVWITPETIGGGDSRRRNRPLCTHGGPALSQIAGIRKLATAGSVMDPDAVAAHDEMGTYLRSLKTLERVDSTKRFNWV
jgi:hypothetical protein